MHKLYRSSFTGPTILLACMWLLSSCSSQFAQSMRSVTYPPDFNYVESDKLRSDMDKLAQSMRSLDQALILSVDQNSIALDAQRSSVVTALRDIERVASNLQANGGGANHPFMQDYMQEFVAKVGEARIAASLEKPRYYLAGRVAGACVNCHVVNRD